MFHEQRTHARTQNPDKRIHRVGVLRHLGVLELEHVDVVARRQVANVLAQPWIAKQLDARW